MLRWGKKLPLLDVVGAFEMDTIAPNLMKSKFKVSLK